MSHKRNNSSKPFTAYQGMLRERLHPLIVALASPLKSDVEVALRQRGKLLCPTSDLETPSRPNGMWALLPFCVMRDFQPHDDPGAACLVAIAVECLINALDLLDDIEDGDQTAIVRQLGPARVLNVSTALLLLAQQALLSLAESGIAAERIVKLTSLMQQATLAAAMGQHEDIVGEQQEIASYTTDDCIRVARGKAGSLMRLACTIGCTFAGVDEHLTLLFAEIGELLGIAHQLDNDSHDLYSILHTQGQDVEKTDLEKQKKTLPLVLAAQTRSAQGIATPAPDEAELQNAYLQSLHEGIITTWGMSLLYRERAHESLHQIEAQQPLSHELHLLLGFV